MTTFTLKSSSSSQNWPKLGSSSPPLMWWQYFSIIPPENYPRNSWVFLLSWEQTRTHILTTLSPDTGAFVEFMFHSVPQSLFGEPLVAWMEQRLGEYHEKQPERSSQNGWCGKCVLYLIFLQFYLWRGKKQGDFVSLAETNQSVAAWIKMNNHTTLNWF